LLLAFSMRLGEIIGPCLAIIINQLLINTFLSLNVELMVYTL